MNWSNCWIAQLVAHSPCILRARGSRPGRGVNSVRLTTGGYCCGWRHSGGLEGTGDGPSWLSFARKGKRDVALLTNGVTSVLSGELKPATLTLTLTVGWRGTPSNGESSEPGSLGTVTLCPTPCGDMTLLWSCRKIPPHSSRPEKSGSGGDPH